MAVAKSLVKTVWDRLGVRMTLLMTPGGEALVLVAWKYQSESPASQSLEPPRCSQCLGRAETDGLGVFIRCLVGQRQSAGEASSKRNQVNRLRQNQPFAILAASKRHQTPSMTSSR